jgi:hypothetical protein
VRWLDLIIDLGYQQFSSTSVSSRFDFGPYSLVGSVFNVVFSAGLIVVGIWGWVSGELGDGGAGLAALGAALEVIFVRTCVRAFRGDFDDFVVPSDDDEQDP